ncbi:MAG: winged helix-turn-helix domain-containing protein [Pyrinomonadaceae bacterium]
MNDESKQTISFEGFELDAAHRRLTYQGQVIPLNAKAFDLLVYLAENAGRLVTKNEIMDAVWADQFVEEANLKVQVSSLRKALGERKDDHRFLATIPGKGYKFIADIQNDEGDLIIESHRVSRMVVEEEIERENPTRAAGATSVRSGLSRPLLLAIGGSAVLLAVSFVAFRYFSVARSGALFGKTTSSRITNNGGVTDAAISADGKYITYALSESEGNSLWIQQVGTASVLRLVPPAEAQVVELTFTPDGSHVVYSLFRAGQADLEFYRVTTLGGVIERIPHVIASFVAFAPDGKRIAYAQADSAAGQNYLVIADADGTNQRTIATKGHPNTFETNASVVAWSPDGETIACLVNHFDADASYSQVVGINTKDGSERLLSEQRWYDVFDIDWLQTGGGLLISASEGLSGRNQIHFLPQPAGPARPVTNDLNQYNSVSATADGRSFVTIQSNTVNSIAVGQTDADPSGFQEVLSETGELFPLVWRRDGRIVYRSNKDGVANLWTMDASGGDRRQLTVNAQVDSRGLCASPDGKFLIFGSWRGGKSNLWRVDADGGNLTQLTNGDADVYPSCSPDNRMVIYQRGLHTQPILWKVPRSGGEPVQLMESRAKWSAISNDGAQVSYFFMADGKWNFGIVSSNGGTVTQRLEVPANLQGSTTAWSTDDRSLFYIGKVGSVGNIWSLPLDGAAAKPLTKFTSHSIDNFSFAPDGKRLAIARSLTVSDAMLVTNVPSP